MIANNLKEPGKLLFANWGINLDEVPLEQLDHYIAVENYLTDDDEPPLDATNLEKVQGYLEAFHHLSEMEAWEKACQVIASRLNTPTNEQLHNQLHTWGYYREQAGLYSRLLNQLSSNWNAIFFNGLGNTSAALGEYTRATEYYQKTLAIAQKIQDSRMEEVALGNLGLVFHSLGDYPKAIEYYQETLAIAQEIQDRQGEGNALSSLGTAYDALGDYNKALDYYQKTLAIAQEIQDHRAIAFLIRYQNLIAAKG